MRSVIDYPGPMLGEPLPLELVNTRYLTRGHPRDGLTSVELLGAWLARVRSRLRLPPTDDDLRTISEADLSAARDLRDCVQSLATGGRPAADALDRLNQHARSAVLWNELRWETGPRAQLCSSAAAITITICEIAADAIELFAGPRAADIRSCGSPNCILYFVKDHARREWCSVACGNRVRAARHYERRRAAT